MAQWLRVFIEGTEQSARVKICLKEDGPQGRPLSGERVRLFSIKDSGGEEPLLFTDQPDSNEVTISQSGSFELSDFRVSEWKAAGYKGIRAKYGNEARQRYFDEIEAPRQNGGAREPKERQRQREEKTDMSGSGKKQDKPKLGLVNVTATYDAASATYEIEIIGYVSDITPLGNCQVGVTLDGKPFGSALTDADGRFELKKPGVQPKDGKNSGEALLRAQIKAGNAADQHVVNLPPKAKVTLISVTSQSNGGPRPDGKPGYRYSVTATAFNEDATAVPKAKIEFREAGNRNTIQADDSGDADYTVDVDPDKTVTLLIGPPGFKNAMQTLELPGPAKPPADKFEIEVDAPRDPVDLSGTLVFLVPVRTKKNGKVTPVELAGTASTPVSFGTTRTPQMLFDNKISFKVTPEGGDDTFVVEFKPSQATLKLKVPGTDVEHEFVLVK